MFGNFEYNTQLQYENRALQHEVDVFKSGDKYISMVKEHKAVHSADIREIKRVSTENAELHREIDKIRKNGFDVIDDLEKEHQKEIKKKDKDLEKEKARTQVVRNKNITLLKENVALRKQIKDLQKEVERERNRADTLAGRLKKNSTTSDQPPSSDPLFTKAKAESTKEKSGKSVGGQTGHKGHYLHQVENPDNTVDKAPPKLCPNCNGEIIINNEYEVRQVFDIEISVSVKEERSLEGICSCCGQVVCGEFSKEFTSPASYGPTIKSIITTLSTDSNVTVNKLVKFISNLTDGKINMSDGTVINMIKELAEKLKPSTEEIATSLASSDVLNVDETGFSVNGEITWMQIVVNKDYSLFARNEKRGTLNEDLDTLINIFTGTLIHDHLSSYYNYKHTKHGECNIHGTRYLKAVTEIFKHPWAQAMTNLLLGANSKKKELIANNIHSMTDEELSDIRNKYIEILDQGQVEYDTAVYGKTHISYYKEERRLLKRLREFINEHLLYLQDFNVPFGNNLAEVGARYIKGKKKTSGCFRSNSGMDHYATIASVIATLRKQHRAIFSTIRSTFLGSHPDFTTISSQNSS